MELIEREQYLNDLNRLYQQARLGIGHSIFLTGEAGIGKTSLVNTFTNSLKNEAAIYLGACDSLFTPRPLGPLFDIEEHFGKDFIDLLRTEQNKSIIFAALVQQIAVAERPVILVFEDIHWADEASLDLIKFLARRVSRFRCLFILTYRDYDTTTRIPLSKLFGDLPADNFSKLNIENFSRHTVDRLAKMKGLPSGEKLYSLTGGNPFYITEILASYSLGIPARVKDSILALFQGRPQRTRELWEFLSVLPSSRIEPEIVRRIENDFADCIDACMAAGIIVSTVDHISFKHELYRLTIEESLSQSKRKSLHHKMLSILQENSVKSINLSQLVHHAVHAGDRELVLRYAPEAARQAAAVGAHQESSRLYATAIDHTSDTDPRLPEYLEKHAYECFLTSQISLAVISQERALAIWKDRKVTIRIGDTMRFLSTLRWVEGDHSKAYALSQNAIEILENGFPTRERAWAYSNFSLLNRLSDNLDLALIWGDKAIELAEKMHEFEIVSHAMNHLGDLLIRNPSTQVLGEEKLRRSLAIALEHEYHEQAARAYSNLSTSMVWTRQYEKGFEIFEEGLKYCETFDLHTWKNCITSCKAQVLFETGNWLEAEGLAKFTDENSSNHVKIRNAITLARLEARRGNFAASRSCIDRAKVLAIPTREAQRIVPVLTAELELSWLKGETPMKSELAIAGLFPQRSNSWYYTELSYWKFKCGIDSVDTDLKYTTPFELELAGQWTSAADRWSELGSPYEQALALFEDDEENQKQALRMLADLGAVATLSLLKSKLKQQGVKNIPRGIHESTRRNPGHLTNRQIDVLVLLKIGLQNSEIAERLFISTKTVDHHVTSIFQKLNVNARQKAVYEGERLGILN